MGQLIGVQSLLRIPHHYREERDYFLCRPRLLPYGKRLFLAECHFMQQPWALQKAQAGGRSAAVLPPVAPLSHQLKYLPGVYCAQDFAWRSICPTKVAAGCWELSRAIVIRGFQHRSVRKPATGRLAETPNHTPKGHLLCPGKGRIAMTPQVAQQGFLPTRFLKDKVRTFLIRINNRTWIFKYPEKHMRIYMSEEIDFVEQYVQDVHQWQSVAAAGYTFFNPFFFPVCFSTMV